jgi:DNA-binding NtrC family response regulator
MSDPAQPEQPSPPRRPTFPWRTFFHRSSGAVFVVSAARRLRYANPAWEKLTGRPLAKLRGMRVSARRSTSALGQALAAPPEVWAGRPAQVRRAVPPADAGPPWWDITFVPLPGNGRALGVLGFVTTVGEKVRKAEQAPVCVADLRARHAAAFPFELFAGPSPASQRLLNQIHLAAQTTVPLWVIGEPGAGKETLARVVHHNGPTRERTFFALDCAAVQPGLLEGLLFGKGGLAGTAHLGTVYLKHPASLTRDLQDRLAQWLTSPGAPRLICGSPNPAQDDVTAGRLVASFHDSLSVLELRVPPLRDRPDDLPRLADALLARIGTERLIADDVWAEFRAYGWPGNVRELAVVLASAAAKAPDVVIEPAHLPRSIKEAKLCVGAAPPARPRPVADVLAAVERRMIELALRRAGPSQTATAEWLGWSRNMLFRRMKELGIAPPTKPTKPDAEADRE